MEGMGMMKMILKGILGDITKSGLERKTSKPSALVVIKKTEKPKPEEEDPLKGLFGDDSEEEADEEEEEAGEGEMPEKPDGKIDPQSIFDFVNKKKKKVV